MRGSKYIRNFVIAVVIAVIAAYLFGEFALKEGYAKLGTIDRKIMEIEGADAYLVEGREGYCMLVDKDSKKIASLKPLRADYNAVQVGDFLITHGRSGDGVTNLKKTLESGKAFCYVYQDIVLSSDYKYMAVREGNESYIKTLDNETVSELGDCWVSYMGDGYVATRNADDKAYIHDINTGEILYTLPDKESICGRSAGMWIIEGDTGTDDSSIFSFYYLRDSSFEVACGGKIFTDISWSDNYVGGAVTDAATYESRAKMAENGLFNPKFEPVGNFIFDLKQEIVYETGENQTLQMIIGDYAVFDLYGDTPRGREVCISLSPETRGQEVPPEQAYQLEEVKR